MKRLLAVSWEMPPMYGPRATQVSRVLSELPGLGWRPTVICLAPRPAEPHVFSEGPVNLPGVDLVRVPSPQESFAVRASFRLAPGLRDYPDAARAWVPRASRAATRTAASGDFTGLITFAQPWSDHLVGLRVHRTTGLPWVAHFSDPWADSPYATPRQRTIWRRMEEPVVRETSGIVFVTDETADLVMAKYPDAWRKKVSVVPHGYDYRPVNVPAPSPSSPERDRPMRLVYAGRFYTGVRTPLGMLRALAEWRRRNPDSAALDVTFIGPHVEEFKRDAAELGVDAFVTFRGRVTPAEAARVSAAADALLVIDAPSHGPSVFLPSKLVDYLPLRKPIVGITPEPGASARLLRRLGCPVAPPDDVAAIASVLDGLVEQWRAGTLSVSDSFDRVAAEFDIRATAGLLNAALTRAFA
jgi:glycosyltransferase involved in cell wall biosynthesis